MILGCGGFGGVGSSPAFFGKGETKEQSFALMDAAWEAGIETFDTADAYGGGRSEAWIGDWLRTKGPEVRDRIVLSTKTFNPMDEGADHGLAPARVRRQVESSLQRLGVERVDMFLAHEWDPDVPVAETAGALDELVAAGKIGAYGLSNVDGAQLREALAAGSFGWVQNSYSLLDRTAEREVLPLCAGGVLKGGSPASFQHGLGFTPFSPLAGGWLTGKYRRGEPLPAGSRMTQRPEPYRHLEDERVYGALEALAAAAQERGATMAALALAWLLTEPRRHRGHRGPAACGAPRARARGAPARRSTPPSGTRSARSSRWLTSRDRATGHARSWHQPSTPRRARRRGRRRAGRRSPHTPGRASRRRGVRKAHVPQRPRELGGADAPQQRVLPVDLDEVVLEHVAERERQEARGVDRAVVADEDDAAAVSRPLRLRLRARGRLAELGREGGREPAVERRRAGPRSSALRSATTRRKNGASTVRTTNPYWEASARKWHTSSFSSGASSPSTRPRPTWTRKNSSQIEAPRLAHEPSDRRQLVDGLAHHDGVHLDDDPCRRRRRIASSVSA